jgi:hypothetical protein
MRSDLVDITVKEVHRTERAILVDSGSDEVWLPLSQIEIEDKGDGLLEVTMKERLAREKGLI